MDIRREIKIQEVRDGYIVDYTCEADSENGTWVRTNKKDLFELLDELMEEDPHP